jgi:SAM-dependent methyltransferase
MTSAAGILAEQRALWGTAPRDWADLAEQENAPLYERMLDLAGLAGSGDLPEGRRARRLLDVACGSGLLVQLAATRGAEVAGIDITPRLLAIARERTPSADLREGDMSALPFADASFDAVTGANAFQFAPDPALAFAEAARVLCPRGRLVAVAFAEPERNEGTVMHLAMKSLVEQIEGREDGYAPYALSEPGGLEQAVADAGLDLQEAGEIPVAWHYADRDAAIRALLASAGGARAVKVAGRERVCEALIAAMPPFTGPDGAVTMHNLFRYVLAERPK